MVQILFIEILESICHTTHTVHIVEPHFHGTTDHLIDFIVGVCVTLQSNTRF